MTDRNGQNRGQPSSPKHAGAKLDEAAAPAPAGVDRKILGPSVCVAQS